MVRFGLLALSIAVAAGACGAGSHRETFGIIGYRFQGNQVYVDSQRPGDPGCYVDPRMDARLLDDGLHLRVTYLRSHQKFCTTPCPIGPLTQTASVSRAAVGRPVILDTPQNRACSPPQGGPAVVPPR